MAEETLEGFAKALGSKAPTPGGGGAAAAVAALAAALGEMVCNFTVGKPKYAEHEEELQGLLAQLAAARPKLLAMIDADAEAFGPVAAAYSIPKDDPKRPEIMEAALRQATETPLALMEAVAEVIVMLERLSVIGSKMVLSDVGVGATCAEAALKGASLNVFINTASMADKALAEEYESRAEGLLEEYVPMARKAFDVVAEGVRA